jgi:hypothetical protein
MRDSPMVFLWDVFSGMNNVTLDRGDVVAELCPFHEAAVLREQPRCPMHHALDLALREAALL